MKKQIITSTLVAGALGLVSPASAATLILGTGGAADDHVTWFNTSVAVEDHSTPATTVFTDANDVTFTITVASALSTARSTSTGGRFGIGSGNNADNSSIEDGESFTLSIAISGTGTLDSLSFVSASLELFAVGVETATFSNSGGSYEAVDNNEKATAAEFLTAGLTTLSSANVGFWDLTLTGADKGTDIADFSMGDLKFDYTTTAVPEPSSSALLGLGALALILRRRKG